MERVSISGNDKGDVWFIYDGDCPVCQVAARGLRIKKAVGDLHLINAREETSHPLIKDINDKGLDLDEGMVIKFHHTYYHGADALQVMALLGTNQGWFNRMNYLLFRSPTLSRLCYPPMRTVRNIALKIKGISKIHNLHQGDKPIFQPIFGKSWDGLSPVIHKHYANRPYSTDKATVEGTLDVMCKWYIKPVLWLFGTVPPYNENNVPVTVHFTSHPDSKAFGFERIFHFRDRKPFRFSSRVYPIKENEVMEVMNVGICWHSYYSWDGDKVVLAHKGYSLRIFGSNVPLPITFLLGEGHAYEIPISDDVFDMCATITHPLLGKIYEYKGQFKMVREAW